MRPFVLLAVAGLFAALLVSVLLQDLQAEREAARPSARSAPSAPPAREAAAPLAAARSATESDAPPPAPVASLEDGGSPAPVGVDFGWKYGRDGRKRLGERLTLLEGDVQSACDREFVARFERQQFESYSVSADGAAVETLVDTLKRGGELCSTRVVVDASGGGTLATRPSAIQIVRLPRAEFAQLYALVEERDWLRAYVARLDSKRP